MAIELCIIVKCCLLLRLFLVPKLTLRTVVTYRNCEMMDKIGYTYVSSKDDSTVNTFYSSIYI